MAVATVMAASCVLAVSCQRQAVDGAIRVSGNIEVDDARLAFKVPGIVVLAFPFPSAPSA